MNYEELEKLTEEKTDVMVDNLELINEIIPYTKLSNEEIVNFHEHILKQMAQVSRRFNALSKTSNKLLRVILERKIRYNA